MTKKLKKPQLNKGAKIGLNEAAVKVDYDRQPPVFCLRFIDPEYCITRCTKDEKASFADKLRQMSQMTWLDLRLAPKHGAGSEKIARKAIKRPIPKQITEEVPILAFRFDGKKPMVGYRIGGTFHIVWFDRDFTLYDHGE